MAYSISDLEREISEIHTKGKMYTNPVITAILHTPDRDYNISRLLHLDIDSNYNADLMDRVTIDFMMQLGDYRDIILDNRDTLEVTISIDYTTQEQYPKSTDTGIYNREDIILKNETYKGDKPIVNRYRFMLLAEDKRFNSSIFNKKSTEELNDLNVITVNGQCVDMIIMGLKQYVIGGIYREYTVEKVIKGLLSKYLDKLNIGGDTFKYKFNFVTPDNSTVYDHVIIKSNTKVIKLPHTLQTGDYGIYNTGLNLYISKDIDDNYIVNIYPLYDKSKFETTDNNRLLLYSSDKTSTSLTEVTYYKENQSTKDIKMVASDITISNTGSNKLAEVGDSLFNVDPNTVLDNTLKSFDEENTLFDTTTLLNKETLLGNKSRISKYIDTNQDDNLFKYRTQIIELTNVMGSVSIPKSDVRIFTPGMCMVYIHSKGDIVIKQYGTIQNVSTSFNIVKKISETIVHFTIENI